MTQGRIQIANYSSHANSHVLIEVYFREKTGIAFYNGRSRPKSLGLGIEDGYTSIAFTHRGSPKG